MTGAGGAVIEELQRDAFSERDADDAELLAPLLELLGGPALDLVDDDQASKRSERHRWICEARDVSRILQVKGRGGTLPGGPDLTQVPRPTTREP
jgi:hypothetical protein